MRRIAREHKRSAGRIADAKRPAGEAGVEPGSDPRSEIGAGISRR